MLQLQLAQIAQASLAAMVAEEGERTERRQTDEVCGGGEGRRGAGRRGAGDAQALHEQPAELAAAGDPAGGAAAHLPAEQHGLLGPLEPDNYARIRAWIMQLLRGR